MNGLELVATALLQIGANFRSALYYSLPFIAYNLLNYAYNFLGFGTGLPAGGNPLLMVLKGGCIVWSAVLWHRFILDHSHQAERLLSLTEKLLWGYFWRFLLLGLFYRFIMLLMLMAWHTSVPNSRDLVVDSLSDWNPTIYALAIIPSWAVFRLSLILPAIALSEKLSFLESWKLTASSNGAILMVAILTNIGIALSEISIRLVAFNGFLPGVVVGFIADWTIVMFNISILTTLYAQLKKDPSISG